MAPLGSSCALREDAFGFITSSGVEQSAHYRVSSSENVDAVALFSDGLQMLAIVHRDNTAHGPSFTPLFDFVHEDGAAIEDLKGFFVSDNICERTDDDKTLVLAVRTP